MAIPGVEPFENVDEADRAVVSTDTPGSQTAAPDPRDLIATRLSSDRHAVITSVYEFAAERRQNLANWRTGGHRLRSD